MCNSNNEKWKKKNNGRNRTANSRKYQNALRNGKLQVLGNKVGTIKHADMKEKLRKEYLRRSRKLLKTKLCSRNPVKCINTWAAPLVRYSGTFLKLIREELKQMEPSTRKLMTMHKVLHPRDDIDRLYVSRKEGGRRLASIEVYVSASIQGFENNI